MLNNYVSNLKVKFGNPISFFNFTLSFGRAPNETGEEIRGRLLETSPTTPKMKLVERYE
jgi:hypothetical protein